MKLSLPWGIAHDMQSSISRVPGISRGPVASKGQPATLPEAWKTARLARWRAVALAASEALALEAAARYAQVCAQLTSAVSAVDGTVNRVRAQLRRLIRQRLVNQQPAQAKNQALNLFSPMGDAPLTSDELSAMRNEDFKAAAQAFASLPPIEDGTNFTELQKVVGARDISVHIILAHAPI